MAYRHALEEAAADLLPALSARKVAVGVPGSCSGVKEGTWCLWPLLDVRLGNIAQSSTCPRLKEPFWVHVRLQRWKKDPVEMLVFSSNAANQSNWLMGRSPAEPQWHLIVLENHRHGRRLLLTPCVPVCAALQPLAGDTQCHLWLSLLTFEGVC